MLSDFAATLDGEGRVVDGLSAPKSGPAAAGAVKGAFLLDLLHFPADTADALEVEGKLRRVLCREWTSFEHTYRIVEGRRQRGFLLKGFVSPAERGACVIQMELHGSALPASAHEAYLQALVDSSDIAVFAKDVAERYTHANRATADLFGLADPALLIGKCDEELFPKNKAQHLAEMDRHVLEEGQAIVQREEVIHPSGALNARWISITKQPVFNEGRRIIGLVGIARELPEHRGLEARLRELLRCLLSFEPEQEANIRCVLRVCRDLLCAAHCFYARTQQGQTLYPDPQEPQCEAVPLCLSDSLLKELSGAAGERPVVVQGVEPTADSLGCNTLVAVPVRWGQEQRAVLVVVMPRPWTPDVRDEEVLMLCARAIAVEEQRLDAERDLGKTVHRSSEAQAKTKIASGGPLGRTRRGKDPPAGGSETILVVDDEPMVLTVTSRLLDQLGYTVLMAQNGKEAVGVAKKHKGPLDVILLDMCMPVMDGAAAYPLLRKARPETPIILCSGFDVNDRVEELLELGAAGFLRKPYRLAVLGPMVRKVLDG